MFWLHKLDSSHPGPVTRCLGWETKPNGIARPSYCLHQSLLLAQGGVGFNKTFYSSKEPTLHNHKTMRPTNHPSTCDAWKGWACCVAHSPLPVHSLHSLVFAGELVTTTTKDPQCSPFALRARRKQPKCWSYDSVPHRNQSKTTLTPLPTTPHHFPGSLCHSWRDSTDQGRLWLN